jgi:hypothetical protein
MALKSGTQVQEGDSMISGYILQRHDWAAVDMSCSAGLQDNVFHAEFDTSCRIRGSHKRRRQQRRRGEKDNMKRGRWTPEEDNKLLSHVTQCGARNWRLIPENTGLQWCSKSCRLRWTTYLRPRPQERRVHGR